MALAAILTWRRVWGAAGPNVTFGTNKKLSITKASEASWSYSCDSKVSFDRVQILTPDFSGRRPPPPPPPPSPHLPSPHLPSPLLLLVFLPSSLPPPSSQVRLRPVVALWHAVSVAYLAAALAHSHSHSLTVSLSLSSLSSLSHLSHLSLLSLSLSPLGLSSFRLSSLSSLAGGSGQRATYKGLFTKSAVFFPTSLPSTFPFWSASFRPPLDLKSRQQLPRIGRCP